MTKPVIMSTRSCKDYAHRVNAAFCAGNEYQNCATDLTNAFTVLSFADGEMEVRLEQSVRGRMVILFTNAARNPYNLSVETCKIELYHAIDVLRRSQAKGILVFEPYLSCSRSDLAMSRNSVGVWVHYKTLASLGMTHFVTWQMHSDKSRTIFDPCTCAIDDLPAMILMQRYLCDTSIADIAYLEHRVRNNWLFCSVDAGGERLARNFATAFGCQLMVAHKQRNYNKTNSVEGINLLSAVPLAGKTVWVVDDMIDTAGSIDALVREVHRHGVDTINVMVVHPVFSPPAVHRLSDLKKLGLLNRLVVCDTIPCSMIKKELPFLEIIDSTVAGADILRAIVENRPISKLISLLPPEDLIRQR